MTLISKRQKVVIEKTKEEAPSSCHSRHSISESRFIASIHPREPQVSQEVNGYFLKHWPWASEKAKKKFVAAGFPRVTCFYYPEALDDRIALACRLLTILFLIDDLLEGMSLDDGSAYNEKLILISRGDISPDSKIPVEWMMHDMWRDMRACDKELADEILEPVFTFMRAQTDRTRLSIRQLGQYLEYREGDVGKAMKLHISPDELESVRRIERNCSKHISVVNDIYSWDKELAASRTGHEEGSALCSSVSVLASETDLDFTASKRVLLSMCREWELVHEDLVEKRLDSSVPCSRDLRRFMKGLEYKMSGNEAWSISTPRYHSIGASA